MEKDATEKQISHDELVADLHALGVQSGDHLALGVSFKSLGPVEGGPQTLVDALRAAVGPQGTLMIPAFTQNFPLNDLKKGRIDYVFDYKTTPATTGLIAEVLRAQQDAVRSRHPTNSIVALGQRADFLTHGHDANSSAYAPYSRLASIDGKILCIGIGDQLVGLRHEAQYLAGLLDVVPLRRGVSYMAEDGTVRLFVRADMGGCTERLPALVPPLRDRGYIVDGRLGHAAVIIGPVKALLEHTTQMLREHPEWNLCDQADCLWCRELERRMKLYRKPGQTLFFQRSGVIRHALALINWFRLRNIKKKEIETWAGRGRRLSERLWR